MKGKLYKILGVGLTLSLLASLLLVAAPVSADVSQATVDLEKDEISETNAEYILAFRINKALVVDDGVNPTITVKFPDDTDVAGATVANLTGVTFTSGIGYESGYATPGALVKDPDDLTVEIELTDFSQAGLPDPPKGIGAMAYVQVVITGITNPSDPGTYTLEVKTSAEDTYVESESYDIGAPALPGGIYVYNASGILVNFETELGAAVNPVTAADFTIVVGPGTYVISSDDPITISGKGLTLKSSAGAAATIIDAATNSVTPAIKITGDDVIVDGFTIEAGGGPVIWILDADGVTVQNNIVTSTTFVMGIESAGGLTDNATISGNTLENANIYLTAGGNTVSDNTISGSKITEGGITLQVASDGNIISGNTVSGVTAGAGIQLGHTNLAGAIDDNLIQGNTLSSNDKGIWVVSDTTTTLTNLQILNNDIIDNEEDGIQIADGTWDVEGVVSNVIKFNTITGNGDDGINNLDSEVDVDATFNWWGTTVADDIGDMVSEKVTYEPFLTDTAELAIFGGKAVANASSLDAKTACGVKVSGVDDGTITGADNGPRVADVISALKYTANPADDIDDAIGFYDVYVVLETDFATTDVTAKLKFYDSAINTGSVANFWTGDFWAECTDYEARDGIIYVSVSDDTLPAIDELEETIFVVVAGEVVEEAFGAPVIAAPVSGAEDVILKPTLAWGTVAGTIGYDFELADNPLFVMPIVSLTGDMARLITPFYQQVTTLDYSTYYYWRVKAVSADDESVWNSAVFMTMAEPIPEPEPEPRMWICPQCGLTYSTRAKLEAHAEWAHQPVEPADIVVVPPDIIVPLPDVAAPITPGWIYAIIGVGAVLVIALLVLIVRTRRVV